MCRVQAYTFSCVSRSHIASLTLKPVCVNVCIPDAGSLQGQSTPPFTPGTNMFEKQERTSPINETIQF